MGGTSFENRLNDQHAADDMRQGQKRRHRSSLCCPNNEITECPRMQTNTRRPDQIRIDMPPASLEPSAPADRTRSHKHTPTATEGHSRVIVAQACSAAGAQGFGHDGDSISQKICISPCPQCWISRRRPENGRRAPVSRAGGSGAMCGPRGG